MSAATMTCNKCGLNLVEVTGPTGDVQGVQCPKYKSEEGHGFVGGLNGAMIERGEDGSITIRGR